MWHCWWSMWMLLDNIVASDHQLRNARWFLHKSVVFVHYIQETLICASSLRWFEHLIRLTHLEDAIFGRWVQSTVQQPHYIAHDSLEDWEWYLYEWHGLAKIFSSKDVDSISEVFIAKTSLHEIHHTGKRWYLFKDGYFCCHKVKGGWWMESANLPCNGAPTTTDY